MRRLTIWILFAALAARGSERDLVREQMRLRPSDPWPRGMGHVVLAAPGSLMAEKAYLEPGGSFSPAVGTFGFSFWLPDGSTSDSLPLASIRQSFVWVPRFGVLTETPQYRAVWRAATDGGWDLFLKSHAGHIAVVIRSVGPAGGPVTSLIWKKRAGQLLVNDRWEISGLEARVALGQEGTPGWQRSHPGEKGWVGASGWGYARIEPLNRDFTLHLRDLGASAAVIKASQLRSHYRLHLPDPRFAECLDSQVAHLMMGLVQDETRPGDPVNYRLSWLRDGAYVVAALARAGQIDSAKELALYVAQNDFFGGFGAEADAPGLALWALGETAAVVAEPAFDTLLLPHVRRKAGLILQMLAAKAPFMHAFTGPVVPEYEKRSDLTLVADPARDGLIVGHMDHQRPLLFVNAVSYLGLMEAARIAARAGDQADAERWQARAAALQQAWVRALRPPESENERTWISGLWPSWIAAPARQIYRKGLAADTQAQFGSVPLWTYFEVAKGHQWLYLGEPQRAWDVMTWFWGHQASPGLYTWWEGDGEENTFHLWESIRGWVNPPYVSPHYWTAAEMLLLQLDMLSYFDRSSDPPVLVIGEGIPKAWIASHLRVEGGPADWTWDGRHLRVTVKGLKTQVRPGPSFPAGSLIVETR